MLSPTFTNGRHQTRYSGWRDFYRAIDRLETMPSRCALIREQEAFDEEVRELLYHSHRIIFTVDETTNKVCVHAFRHSAQDDIRREE